jgi:hypothetical protein
MVISFEGAAGIAEDFANPCVNEFVQW